MCETELVTAKAVVEQTGIPRSTLYRLVDAQKIPAYPASKPWHQRRHFLFCVAEVQAALASISHPD